MNLSSISIIAALVTSKLFFVRSLVSDSNKDMCISSMSNLRSVKKVLPAAYPHWVGDGFKVYPVFSNLAFNNELSPLLMFDYAAPKRFPAKLGSPLGVGQHPHRGFETVTIAFQGEVEHHDNKGNTGVIGPGDVQWMTAGRGIVHQEYHSKEFTRTGGVFEMCQLWVNLPKKHKMTKPRYQSILKSDIPEVQLPISLGEEGKTTESRSLGTARIIAGELAHAKGPAKTFSPVQMWDVMLPHAGSEVDFPYPSEHNCIVFVRRGQIEIMSTNNKGATTASKLGPQQVAIMSEDGSNTLRVRVVDSDSSILIMGGLPLGEPIANQGPFVMNNREELNQAIRDYRMGKF